MRLPHAKLALIALFSLLWCPAGNAQTQTAAQPPKQGQTFANAAIDADELADFLGITIWAFAYDGGAPRCWVEVIEEGQKTVSQPKILDVKANPQATDGAGGKILLFLRPGNVELRINSAVSRGGAGIGLPQDALWWGWKGSSGSSTRLERPVALKAGQEVTLLRHEMEEAEGDGQGPEEAAQGEPAPEGRDRDREALARLLIPFLILGPRLGVHPGVQVLGGDLLARMRPGDEGGSRAGEVVKELIDPAAHGDQEHRAQDHQ